MTNCLTFLQVLKWFSPQFLSKPPPSFTRSGQDPSLNRDSVHDKNRDTMSTPLTPRLAGHGRVLVAPDVHRLGPQIHPHLGLEDQGGVIQTGRKSDGRGRQGPSSRSVPGARLRPQTRRIPLSLVSRTGSRSVGRTVDYEERVSGRAGGRGDRRAPKRTDSEVIPRPFPEDQGRTRGDSSLRQGVGYTREDWSTGVGGGTGSDRRVVSERGPLKTPRFLLTGVSVGSREGLPENVSNPLPLPDDNPCSEENSYLTKS